MPLHLLQQLGHSNIEQTMCYSRFHPEYGDVSEYFETVGADLGLGRAEGAEPGHSSGHTPDEEVAEEVSREAP